MKEIYVQGSLYLRKDPRINREEFRDLLYDENFDFSDEYYEELTEEIIDYDKAKAIYQLVITEEGMFLRQRNNIGDYFYKAIPVNEVFLKAHYISLDIFLNEAKYIGKTGRMIDLAENKSDLFVNKRNPIILYKSDTHIILYNDATIYRSKTPIEILDYRYCGNWEYYGEEVDIYKDSNLLYRDLLLDSLPESKVLKRTFPKIVEK